MTSTINYPFGAKILSRSTGIVMNDEMGDFSLPTEDFPARTNFIRPFKRPLSSMAPTIVLQDGQVRGVVGASGGTRIITAAAQVFLDYFVKGLNPLSSVVHPRVHHQLIPNVVSYENWTTAAGDHIELKEEWVEALRRKGHILQGGTGAISQLVVQELHTDGASSSMKKKQYGRLIAISDPRKDGSPSAF